MMDLEYMLSLLEDKATSKTFEALKELENISENSNILYPHIDKFIEMTGSETYAIRVRGFRLFCKQAKWDVDNKIDENLTHALQILQDNKPTAVRQALASLNDVVIYKNDLASYIKECVSSINYLRYKDTMHNLIAKDIQKLLETIEQNPVTPDPHPHD